MRNPGDANIKHLRDSCFIIFIIFLCHLIDQRADAFYFDFDLVALFQPLGFAAVLFKLNTGGCSGKY